MIETLRSSHPNIDNLFEGIEDSFTVSKTAKSCSIEFLTENDVEITSWITEVEGNDRVKNVLRVWFSLFKPYNQNESS